MSAGGATSTGVKEMLAAIETLPAKVTEALRGVASNSAHRIQTRARQRLDELTQGTGATAAEIKVFEEADKKQFLVLSEAPEDRPANLPTWLEFGTRYMEARPYMRPALDEEQDPYRREMERASLQVASEAMK